MPESKEELEKLRDKVARQSGARALASPQYFIVQQLAVVVSLNLAFPYLLDLSWQGDYLEQAFFVFLYAIVYSIAGMIFLAVSAFFAIMLEVVKIYRDIKSGKTTPQIASAEIPYKVMTGSHPKWLIALAPPIVPMASLAFLTLFFSNNLVIPNSTLMLKACVLQAVISYAMSMPFILKAQKALYEVVESEKKD